MPKTNANNDTIKAIKERKIRAKFYKFLAIAMTICAVLVVLQIFNVQADGDPQNVRENPALVLAMVFSFVPAYFLAILSKKRRAESQRLLAEYYASLTPGQKAALGKKDTEDLT